MSYKVNFKAQYVETLVGGISPLDIQQLSIQDFEEAKNFFKAYGYDIEDPADENDIWKIHKFAVAFLKDQLLNADEFIPEQLYNPSELKDIRQLLMYSNSNGDGEGLQEWACALLKVMHVYAHLKNDIFHIFPDQIQDQILRPIERHIYNDPLLGKPILGRASEGETIELDKFEIKPTKSQTSSVLKLIAKRQANALTLLDKIGVRFVTKSLFDAYRVLRYLVDHSLVSYANSIVDQTTNTLYPANIFLEAMDQLRSKGPFATAQEIEETLDSKILSEFDRIDIIEKENMHSGEGYRFMKFIGRQRIKVNMPDGQIYSFFYPFEVQIMDYDTYLSTLSGHMSHEEYKARQRETARKRILPFLLEK